MYVQFYLLKKIGAIKGNGKLMHEPHGKLCLEENKLNILDNISVLQIPPPTHTLLSLIVMSSF